LWPELTRSSPPWKRAMDVLLSGLALIALLPVFVAVAIAIRLDSPGPVIFRQQRAGRGGRPFAFYKFRSMFVDAEQRKAHLQFLNEKVGPIFKIRKDPRITRVGRVLRHWSLDELPQLWNVLKGDFSLVGPRPPTLDEVDRYERWHLRRLDVAGGITGIWQVSGRSEVGFVDWMRMDMQYIAQRGPWLDVRLLLRSVPAVLSGRGAY
jgi:lipopolysaccharide/colanic/teichoic acid biosynthesis glycosyltransferase